MKSQAPKPLAELIHRRPHLQKLIQKHLAYDRNMLILDMGCGHVGLIHFARELGYRNISGIDGSMEQVEVAKSLGIKGIESGNVLHVL